MTYESLSLSIWLDKFKSLWHISLGEKQKKMKTVQNLRSVLVTDDPQKKKKRKKEKKKRKEKRKPFLSSIPWDYLASLHWRFTTGFRLAPGALPPAAPPHKRFQHIMAGARRTVRPTPSKALIAPPCHKLHHVCQMIQTRAKIRG